MALVIDASIAVGWIARSQATRLTDAALAAVADEFGVVPAYFGIEVARALRTHERRNLLSADVIDIGLAQLRALPLREDGAKTLDRLQQIVVLARRHELRVADAAYLELAERRALALACKDGPLKKAANQRGIRLWK